MEHIAPRRGFGLPHSAVASQFVGQVDVSRRMPSNEVFLGKPDAGNLHVRFEEGGGGAGPFLNGPSPLLYSTSLLLKNLSSGFR